MHVSSRAPGHKLVHTASAVPVVGQGQDDLQFTAKIQQREKSEYFDIKQRKAFSCEFPCRTRRLCKLAVFSEAFQTGSCEGTCSTWQGKNGIEEPLLFQDKAA